MQRKSKVLLITFVSIALAMTGLATPVPGQSHKQKGAPKPPKPPTETVNLAKVTNIINDAATLKLLLLDPLRDQFRMMEEMDQWSLKSKDGRAGGLNEETMEKAEATEKARERFLKYEPLLFQRFTDLVAQYRLSLTSRYAGFAQALSGEVRSRASLQPDRAVATVAFEEWAEIVTLLGGSGTLPIVKFRHATIHWDYAAAAVSFGEGTECMVEGKEYIFRKGGWTVPNVAVAADTLTVTTQPGVVYAGPDLMLALLATVPPGARFPLLETRKGWYKIRLDDGREGWIAP